MNYTNQKLEAIQVLKEGETYISGEEWLKRAKAITKGTMDKNAFEFYKKKENWHLLPECDYLYFPDTDYIDPLGTRCVLYFFWHDDTREWCWSCDGLGNYFSANNPSAVFLASPLISDPNPSELGNFILCPICKHKLTVEIK